MERIFACLTALSVLSACDFIPRGAGLQSEVLAERNEVDELGRPEFAVEVVSRENLATFASWPTINTEHLHWINSDDQSNSRTISAGDTLEITVWSNEDNGLLISQGQRSVSLPAARVSPAGRVFLPYIGEQTVSGLSPERARSVIEERYSGVSQSVQVQLNLIEGLGKVVSVVDGVGSPGSYTLAQSNTTVLQILAEAGGVSPTFSNPQVRLQRSGRLYGISAERLLDDPRFNTTMRGGDALYVEEDSRVFLSLGAAGTEAVHAFPKANVTALEALSIIGGVSDSRADAQGILILRRYPVDQIRNDRSGPDHPRTVFTLDLTSADGLFSADQFLIQAGDLVYVSESPITAIRSVFSTIGSVFGLANQIDN